MSKNICLWQGDLCQNVPWSIGLFDILESFGSYQTTTCFGLDTVLYKLYTAT